jgi:hypothetical protein
MAHPNPTRSSVTGLRIFTCGHSFHIWMPGILENLAVAAGIRDHLTVGKSDIGGSRAIQHWDVPEAQNQARIALRAGIVDVLTLSCMTYPDEGIRHFARLAVEHNPNVRVTLQELWLPEDRFPFDPANQVRKSVEEFNGSTMADLKKPHDAYFKVMDDHVRALNTEIGRQTVFIVPDAQATLALRERIIAGTAPGLDKQSDLFTDSWGHPAPPLQLLSAYCHFAVIYRLSPVGLPWPRALPGNACWGEPLNRLLQQLAWAAVTRHPLSGINTGGVL